MEGENEGLEKGFGSLETRVDPTGVMPSVDSGPPVEGYSVSDARAEFNKMTIDDESYKNLPRSVFNKRRADLFKRGWGEEISKQKGIQEEESRKFIEKEKSKIEDRYDREARGKEKSENIRFFGSEPVFDQMVERATKVYNKLSKADQDFLERTVPKTDKKNKYEGFAYSNIPEVIQWIGNLSDDPDEFEKVKANGIQHYAKMLTKFYLRMEAK